MKEEVPLYRAHRLLTSGPICLMTTRYKGEVNASLVPWCCPVSLDPLLLAVALHPSRYVHDMLPRSEECVLNIPGRPLAEQALACGDREGADEERLRTLGLILESGQRVEVPWIDECLAHIECQLVDVLTPGDHSLYIWEVVGAWAETDAFRDYWLQPQEAEEMLPLHYLGGRQFCLMGPVIDLSAPPD
jgi:flavin reductase (DIM6/NTAB) family NADH-FMN oxidoreductase RutF